MIRQIERHQHQLWLGGRGCRPARRLKGHGLGVPAADHIAVTDVPHDRRDGSPHWRQQSIESGNGIGRTGPSDTGVTARSSHARGHRQGTGGGALGERPAEPSARDRWTRTARTSGPRGSGRQLNEYFAGERQTFSVPLDVSGTPFQHEVWAALRNDPVWRDEVLRTDCRSDRPSDGRARGRSGQRPKSRFDHHALSPRDWRHRQADRFRGWPRHQGAAARVRRARVVAHYSTAPGLVGRPRAFLTFGGTPRSSYPRLV